MQSSTTFISTNRNSLLLAFGSLVLFSALLSYSPTTTASLINQDTLDKFGYRISADVGYKSGDYLWNIASDFQARQTPNILSELTYSEIKVLQASINWQMEKHSGSMSGLVIDLNFGTGLINDGTVQDSDYDGDNRTGEFSRSESQTKGSHTLNLAGGIGVALYTKNNWRWVPMVGYAYNSQNFTKTDGVQVLSTTFRTPPEGPFPGLNSTYNAEWYGPWVGLSFGKLGKRHILELSAKMHIPEYYAEADWNLRSDFDHPKSFAHWSDGSANVFKFSYAFRATEKFSIGINYEKESWESEAGIDTVYFSDGESASTQLNEASWKATKTALSLNWHM